MNNSTNTFFYYLIELNYNNFSNEKIFITSVLSRYDDVLTTAILFVINEPSFQKAFLLLNFKEESDLSNFLHQHYPNYKRWYNSFFDDVFIATLKGEIDYCVTLPESSEPMFDITLDFHLIESKKCFNTSRNSITIKQSRFMFFLCHSSSDKALVDVFFETLQLKEISCFYDKFEMNEKLSTEEISENLEAGLNKSEYGIFFLSNSFLGKASKWIEMEVNFFRDSMNKNTKYFVFNIDVPHDNMPQWIEKSRLFNGVSTESISCFIETIRKK